MPEPLRYDLEADVTAALGALQLQVIKLGAENRVLKQRLRELESAGSGSPTEGQAGET